MNRTYENLKLLIERNRYTYDDMMNKLDVFFAVGRITDEQYIELTGMVVPPEPAVPDEPTSEDPPIQ